MNDDDARHQREEEERRAKRKAAKISKSKEQEDKERKNREYRQKILQQHQQKGGAAGAAVTSGSSSNKRPKPPSGPPPSSAALQPAAPNSSVFQKLLEQRSQGFQIEFRFRNAPPRPPVGPCFVGQTIDAVLLAESRQYKALNSVEVNHRWKLHSEADLGVPLAPSAMDVKSYTAPVASLDENSAFESAKFPLLHPDDQALLDWKGPMGDTAADQLKLRQDQARAAARAALSGHGMINMKKLAAAGVAGADANSKRTAKKAFSRVLNESMQTWMKKTTYLSNDYSRRVHDFKSLAQTKQEQVLDLSKKQEEILKRRSAANIIKAFVSVNAPTARVEHPTRKHLKPKAAYQILPNVAQWGNTYTHLVIDKAPGLPQEYAHDMSVLEHALVSNVQKLQANARMSCQLFVPAASKYQDNNKNDNDTSDDTTTTKNSKRYQAVQAYDLDVIPLRVSDAPAVHFCWQVDVHKGVALYLPLSSRVQLSTGRPAKQANLRNVERRPLSDAEQRDREERMAEIDLDMAEKHDIQPTTKMSSSNSPTKRSSANNDGAGEGGAGPTGKDSDDGEDDFGDDTSDSDDDGVFGTGRKTVVAETDN